MKDVGKLKISSLLGTVLKDRRMWMWNNPGIATTLYFVSF